MPTPRRIVKAPLAARLGRTPTGRDLINEQARERNEDINQLQAIGLTPEQARKEYARLGSRAVGYHAGRVLQGIASSGPNYEHAQDAATAYGTKKTHDDPSAGRLGMHNAGKRVGQQVRGLTKGVGQLADAFLAYEYSRAIKEGTPEKERAKSLDLYYQGMGTALIMAAAAPMGAAGGTGLGVMNSLPDVATIMTDPREEARSEAWRGIVTNGVTGVTMGAGLGAVSGATAGLRRGLRGVASGAGRGALTGAVEAFKPSLSGKTSIDLTGRPRAGWSEPEFYSGLSRAERRRLAPQAAIMAKATGRVDAGEKTHGGSLIVGRGTGSTLTNTQRTRRELTGGLFSDEAAAAARKRFYEKLYVAPEGVDVTMISELTIMAGNHIRRAGETFQEWAEGVVKLFGEGVRPHLKIAWSQGLQRARLEARKFDVNHLREIQADTRLRPYAKHKKGPVLSLLAPEDIEFAIDKKGMLRISVVEADRARADGYYNLQTGVHVPADGGVGFALGPGEFGRVAWGNTFPQVAKKLQGRSQASRNRYGVEPLTVATLNGPSNALNSMHGAKILRAELEAAVHQGVATKAEILELFNDSLLAATKGKATVVKSFADMERALAPGKISYLNRGRVVRDLFSSENPFGLPSWEEVTRNLNEPALQELPNGAIAGAMRLDPFVNDAGGRFGVRPHAAYADLTGGVGLGSPNLINPTTLYDWHPTYLTSRMRRLLEEGNTITRLEFINALNRSMVLSHGERGILGVPVSEVERIFPPYTQARVAPRRVPRAAKRRTP